MSLLQTMPTHLDSPECEPSEQAPLPIENDNSAPESELFVSTDLETAKFEWAVTSASDVEYNGKIYRRLEPEYFAWLQFRMMAAQSAFKAGKLPESTWESLKRRFNPLQEYAIQKFGKESLQQASCQLSPQNYQAPCHIPVKPEKPAEHPKNNWIYPPNEAWNCIEQVSSEALAKVDAIKEEAMSRKWSEARIGIISSPVVIWKPHDQLFCAATQNYSPAPLTGHSFFLRQSGNDADARIFTARQQCGLDVHPVIRGQQQNAAVLRNPAITEKNIVNAN